MQACSASATKPQLLSGCAGLLWLWGPTSSGLRPQTSGRVESGVMISPRLRMCRQHPVYSSSKARAHHLLRLTLPLPDFPMSAKGTNLVTHHLITEMSNPSQKVSVLQDDSYFRNLSRISLFFSISTAKFQLSLRLTWTLST